MRRISGYLTVYLTLCLTLIVSLYLVLIDSARYKGAALEAICAAETGLSSVMGEYHRELFGQFGLFGIDCSYGTASCRINHTEEHLLDYVDRNLDLSDVFLASILYRDFFDLNVRDVEIDQIALFSDGEGAVFRGAAIDAVCDDIGLGLLESVMDWADTITVNGLDRQDSEADMAQANAVLDDLNGTEVQISEQETGYVDVANPVGNVFTLKKKGILNLVTDVSTLSEKRINTAAYIQSRLQKGMVSRGNMAFDERDGLTDRFLFQEFLLRSLGHFGQTKEQTALSYQVEYLLAGADSDVENLRKVAGRLCAIREAANAAYLWSDPQKKAEITLAATIACGIFLLPELIPAVTTLIVLGWAYMESIYDVKSLLEGGKVPLWKDATTWHYGLSAACGGELPGTQISRVGLSYEDYLRVLLMLTGLGKLTLRAMDMVEADIRLTPGNQFFRLDGCVAQFRASVRIESGFGYGFEIIRQKGYE
ncbi:MAG: DUF5702 domain-containing protein [Acetatifactor sp.]